jgi:hypothetical protein
MARYPDKGDGYGKKLKVLNNTTVMVPEEWKDYDFTNAQVFVWLRAPWFTEMRKVTGFNKDELKLTIDPGSNNFEGASGRIYIQGVPDLLDSEGEWCLNAKDDCIYYYPAEGKWNLSENTAVVPVVKRILDISGTSGEKKVTNLSFENISFIGSDFTDNWRICSPVEEGNSTPEHLQEGMIYIENAEDISIRFCEITGAGFNGIFINNRSQGCKIYGCSISDAGCCGIYMNSSIPANVQNTAESYINKNHVICNNFIHDCGRFNGAGAGIAFFMSGDNVISNNVICRTPRFGISYNGPGAVKGLDTTYAYEKYYDYAYSRNNILKYNEVYNTCRDGEDFGGIQSWMPGKNNVWYNNAVHDITQPMHWNGWAHGLFADDASGYLTIKNNIVYEMNGGEYTGAIMVKSVSDVIENNIFADNDIGRAITAAPYLRPAADNVIRCNIIYNSGKKLYDVDANSLSEYFGAGFLRTESNRKIYSGRPVFKEVDRNIIYPGYLQSDSLRKYGWDVSSVFADPLFDRTNPAWDLTYKDYKLKEDSPAWNMGFRNIAYDSIGLLNDFPYSRLLVRDLRELIQAEDYNRICGLRLSGEANIYNPEPGSWAKYENADFNNGEYTRFVANTDEMDPAISDGACLFEIRLDSPEGDLIGRMNKGDTETEIKSIRGLHDLFLVFRNNIALNSFRFHKERN